MTFTSNIRQVIALDLNTGDQLGPEKKSSSFAMFSGRFVFWGSLRVEQVEQILFWLKGLGRFSLVVPWLEKL